MRADDDAGARARMHTVLANMFGTVRGAWYGRRVEAVAAELTAPGLGLSRERATELAARVSSIVHSAASVSFTLPLHEAREINVEGTRRMLEFASLAQEYGGLERFGHLSTAYVAGTFTGRYCELDDDVGQGFNNSYEQSKLEAEQLVRSETAIPSTIMRPSIIVGDQRSGWTSAFNVLYWPLRAFSRGLFEAVPAVPTAPVDVVSVDYVADAVYALCTSGADGTYHLTASESASTIEEIAHAASRYFKRPLPEVVPPAEFAGRDCTVIEGSRAYFPYFSVGAVFDDARSRARLGPAGVSVTPLRRVPRPPARLRRDSQPVGEAADRAGRGAPRGLVPRV